MRYIPMATINSKVQNIYGEWITVALPADGHWSTHVVFSEIANPSSGESIILELPVVARLHRDCWEVWREWWGKPVTITCGFRTKSYNALIGGVEDSQHIKCCAYDCSVGAISDSLFKECMDVCFAIAKANHTQCELGRYSWGLHIGFSKLAYTDKTLYTFDKR